MKKLIILLITVLALAFGGVRGTYAGDIKLPIDTCPKESIFIIDSHGVIWHMNNGQISDYYNNMTVEQLKDKADGWDSAQCPPVDGGLIKSGYSVRIRRGYLDDPKHYLTNDQMKKQYPNIWKEYLRRSKQSEI